jgi:NTP pyrophosphatase (non-canonical NTP hydrolase)
VRKTHKNKMTLREYQRLARKMAFYKRADGCFFQLVLGLCSEVGEVAGKAKKLYWENPQAFDKVAQKALQAEFGDVLWMLAACCSELNMSLEDVARANLQKLVDRKKRGVLEGSGDNR